MTVHEAKLSNLLFSRWHPAHCILLGKKISNLDEAGLVRGDAFSTRR